MRREGDDPGGRLVEPDLISVVISHGNLGKNLAGETETHKKRRQSHAAMISARFRVFGKQVRSLYCPRNGKRVWVPNQATARKRGKAGTKTRESGDRPGSLHQLLRRRG